MATKKRVFLAIRGGLYCAILGPLIGGCAFVLISAVLGGVGLTALAALPMAFIMGAVTVGPFGFVVGSIGAWWLAGRVQRISGKRLYVEAVGAGAVLGATEPLALAIFGWGPFENLMLTLPIAMGTGIICAIVLTREVRKYGLAEFQAEQGGDRG